MKEHCHLCGEKNIEGKQQPWVCSGCGNQDFYDAIPAAELLLFNSEDEVLISKRGIEPMKGKYDCPGGFNVVGESLEDGLIREIEEEIGLNKNQYSHPMYFMSHCVEYKFSLTTKTALVCMFVARLADDSADIKANDDVESVKFIKLSEAKDIDFAVESYPSMLEKALKALKSSENKAT